MRLGQPNTYILNTITSKFYLPLSKTTFNSLLCSDCSINKSHKLSFSNSTIISIKPLQYLFSDVWLSPITSIDGYKYYLILVDHFTRYTWLYPLKRKSQVLETFQAFKPLVENKFQTKIGTLITEESRSQ